ncbi:hypothetical protein AcW1_003527 [Taiwanofungus camphoratus]|nr:hypothetical protein AcV5_002008 [Antrodia cinnamomea]KAI0941717.1 hypothetical protein AcW1_003527 [Antrodia cinnamomea]
MATPLSKTLVDRTSEILIVGAGCFGLSTAYHLLKRGFTRVTVLDRSAELPAPDAASTDLNKIVRSSYADIFYAHLAREAIAAWKDEQEWGDTYHESGVFVLLSGGGTYANESYSNDTELGARVESLKDAEAIRAIFPPGVETTSFESSTGYLNRDGGWANSSQGISLILSKVASMGGRVVPGKHVVNLVQQDGKTTSVECVDGTTYNADLIVLSAGSWTASTFPSFNLGDKCLATGQTVAKIQLSPEEADVYRRCPVYLDLNSGFYVFPPNDKNIVKFAIHANGYTHMLKSVNSHVPLSTPTFVRADGGDQDSLVPKTALKELRNALAKVYPALAKKPFTSTRLCWSVPASSLETIFVKTAALMYFKVHRLT